MTLEKFAEYMDKYNFHIIGNAYDGCISFSVKNAIEIFEHYGDDTELYDLEQNHEITRDEYEELKALAKTETIDGDVDNSYLRCSGITKTGERCKCCEPHATFYGNYKHKLEILKTHKYYCPTHKQQEDILLRKASEVVYGGRKCL